LVVLGSWLSECREARRRRLLARPVAALFREEIEQIVDFYSAEGAKLPFKVAPGTPTHDEHGRQLVEILEEEAGLAISRFYRTLAAVEHARAEERVLYGGLEGPGVSKLRNDQVAVVEQRIAALRRAAHLALDQLKA
jgi:DNA-binding GntR family transcriptional regulator